MCGLPKCQLTRLYLVPFVTGVTLCHTKDGKTMTELSIGVQINGKETSIPSIVPTLNAKEIKTLQNLNIGKDQIPRSIAIKAKDYAMQRINKGLSPFYQDGENDPTRPKGLYNNGGLLNRLKRKVV